MRSPLDPRFQKTQQLMRTGQMTGKDRPIARVTWSKQGLRSVRSAKAGVGLVRYLQSDIHTDIGEVPYEYEIYGVRTIDIDRSIGQDAATCTITMWNDWGSKTSPEGLDTSGRKGFYTPGRGASVKPGTASVYKDYRDPFDPVVGRGNDHVSSYPTSWGYDINGYRDALLPNTVIRTYQGYGSDVLDQSGNFMRRTDPEYVLPKDDTQLYETGVWLIDKVTFNADATVTIECRDMAKLLIEQYIYPPMIPTERFPLIYCPAHVATGHKESIGKNVARFHSSSVDARYGRNASIHGHRGSDAFDGRPDSYWLSAADNSVHNVEWIQASVHGQINEVSLETYGGNYVAYISVHENGKWQGSATLTGTSNSENLTAAEGNGGGGFFYVITKGDTLWDLAGKYYGNNLLWPRIAAANNNIIQDPHWIYPGQRIKIPYVAGTKSPPPANGSGTGGTKVSIPYVVRATVPHSGNATIALPRTYNADYVRVVLTNLQQTAYGGPYRAGVRTLTARNHVRSTYKPSTVGKAGFIQDWTEPVKEMCAWAGLTWVGPPQPNVADPVLGRTQPKVAPVPYGSRRGGVQPIVRSEPLRVWGDFERLGAGPVVCTPGDYFLSKSFMEGIRQIVDFIGGIFYVDETGGAQFRLPNIWSAGNFIDDTSAASSLGARINQHPIEFHEDANLTSYQMVLSDESLRSEILVIGGYPGVTSKGPVAGGYVLGYNSATGTTSAIDFSQLLAGQYRLMVVPGDTTKLFYTELECQRMAELTALFILFTYRQGTVQAPAHPGLQIDDQVRIFERVTAENNVHYVSGIRTHQDLESGEYTMEVTTHWLGGDPDTQWFVDKAQLTPAVKRLPAILARIGKQAGGDVFEQPPYGVSS